MRRLGSVALVLLALAVFAAAGYVVVHKTRVVQGGRTPALPSASVPTGPTDSTPGSPAPSVPQSSPTPVPAVVAFLGDDWTAGAGASSKAHRFTTLVCARLGLTEANFGVRGSGYARQGRSGGDYASQVGKVLAVRPAMVVISGGRNDVGEDPAFAGSQASRLIKKLHGRLPRATIVIVAPMWGDSAAPSALHALAGKLKQAAAAVGATYLAIPDPIRGHPREMANSADPDDAGYAAIAQALVPRLAKLAAALPSTS